MIVDTGPLVATAVRNDPDHEAYRELLESAAPPLRVPSLVIAEAAFLIEKALGPKAEAKFLRSFDDGELVLLEVTSRDLRRAAELVETYADMPLGATDATVIAVAERLDESTVATLDRRHFTVVRPRHRDYLTLVP